MVRRSGGLYCLCAYSGEVSLRGKASFRRCRLTRLTGNCTTFEVAKAGQTLLRRRHCCRELDRVKPANRGTLIRSARRFNGDPAPRHSKRTLKSGLAHSGASPMAAAMLLWRSRSEPFASLRGFRLGLRFGCLLDFFPAFVFASHDFKFATRGRPGESSKGECNHSRNFDSGGRLTCRSGCAQSCRAIH